MTRRSEWVVAAFVVAGGVQARRAGSPTIACFGPTRNPGTWLISRRTAAQRCYGELRQIDTVERQEPPR